MSRSRTHLQRGFTIVELMISMAVFSVIILVIAMAVMQFSRQYYKGVISSATQSSARTIVEDITRAIEFNPGAVHELKVGAVVKGYCVGDNRRYSFEPFQKVVDTPAVKHGLVSDSVSCPNALVAPLGVATLGSFSTLPAASAPRELLGLNMRLVKFSVTPSGQLYVINVKVVSGDDNVLCSPSISGDCRSATSTQAVVQKKADVACKSTVFTQYCAVSELTTTVKKRIE